MDTSDRAKTSLESLETLETYRCLFSDADFWRLHVQAVCHRHFQVEDCRVRYVLPGTYPTFIAEERWVVKFFGQLFGGQSAYEKEKEANRLLQHTPGIPAPALIAQGYLLEPNGGWSWPYLIFEFIPGVSIDEVYEQLSHPARLDIAGGLGKIVRRLHSLPLKGSPVFVQDWQAYTEFLYRQSAGCLEKQRSWGSLPDHLIDQIEDYLLPPEALIDWSRQPHLIHADLTRDHLLGRVVEGGWQTLGLIDFGDARVGDLLYELVALHLDLFDGDPRLLRAFLEAYRSDLVEADEFPHRAMSSALLHEFDVFTGLGRRYPEWQEVQDLPALAVLIWKTGRTDY